MRDQLTPSELFATNATDMRSFEGGSICFIHRLTHPLSIPRTGRSCFGGRHRHHILFVILRPCHREAQETLFSYHL